LALALEVLRLLDEDDYEKKIMEKGQYFLAHLRKLQFKYPGIIGNVNGFGLALRIELCQKDGITPNPELAQKVCQEGFKGNLTLDGKKYGLILNVGGYYKNVFSLSPSFEVSREEMDMAAEFLDLLIGRNL
jgi:4-aminobutyrate aminotransferase-like enzyme